MNLKEYLSELKRRNVIKAGIAYLVVAWLIAQVASIVLPTFNAPPYLMKTLLFILGIGFPVWVIFAWVFELTPEGIRKTENVNVKKSISNRTSLRLNRLIIVALSIAVVLLLLNQLLINKNENRHRSPQNLTESIIGVLPFSNSKPDAETDYFGFAIADQIIGDLSYLSSITVRPSSSIRKYEKQVVDSKVAAEELKVGYILAGNFLMEGTTIRLNVELVEINTNEMKWREQIEVEFKNAFELQDIVAKKVVNSITSQFSSSELSRFSKDVPKNPLAYEYYLRGIAFPLSIDGNQLAIKMFLKSIELDSTYAPAYYEYGERLHMDASYAKFDSEKYAQVEKMYLKAIELNNDLISAHSGLAMFYAETGRIEKAVEICNRLLNINPNNADALYSLGYIYRYAGMDQESILKMEQALANDPGNPRFRSLCLSYYNIGEFEKALQVFDRIEGSNWVDGMRGFIYFKQGKTEQALEIFNWFIDQQPDSFWGLSSLTRKSILLGDTIKGIQSMIEREKLNSSDAEPIYYIACDYALLGDKKGCLRVLRKAVNGGYFNYPLMLRDPDLDSMRDEPEFNEILEIAKEKHLAFKKKFFNTAIATT